jgi:hypothetical protein
MFGLSKDNVISECHAKDKNHCPYHTSHQEMTQKEADAYQEKVNASHDTNKHSLKISANHHEASLDNGQKVPSNKQRIESLIHDDDPDVRAEVARNGMLTDSEQIMTLAQDSDKRVRLALTKNAYAMSQYPVFSLLHDDDDDVTISAIDAVQYTPMDMTKSLMYNRVLQYHPSKRVRIHLAKTCTARSTLYDMKDDDSPEVRAIIAQRLNH